MDLLRRRHVEVQDQEVIGEDHPLQVHQGVGTARLRPIDAVRPHRQVVDSVEEILAVEIRMSIVPDHTLVLGLGRRAVGVARIRRGRAVDHLPVDEIEEGGDTVVADHHPAETVRRGMVVVEEEEAEGAKVRVIRVTAVTAIAVGVGAEEKGEGEDDDWQEMRSGVHPWTIITPASSHWHEKPVLVFLYRVSLLQEKTEIEKRDAASGASHLARTIALVTFSEQTISDYGSIKDPRSGMVLSFQDLFASYLRMKTGVM